MTKRWTPDWFASFLAGLLVTGLLVLPGCGGGDPAGGGSDEEDTPDTGTGQANNEPEKVVATIPVLAEQEPAAPENPRAVDPEDVALTVKDGFMVELLHKTNKEDEGSWVALCKGPDNTLYASAQYMQVGRGADARKRQTLYQIKPPAVDDPDGKTQIIAQPVEINGAQGLYYGFGGLYVMESGRDKGLTKVTDSDGDGLLDKKELLLNIWGGGEHGTHAIVPTADGKALYIVAGNMSPLPPVEHSRVPLGFQESYVDDRGRQKGLWDEDQVLEREPDGRGHAAGLLAPGGWICRIDPDGKNLTLICNGFRNQYDIGVHPNGEVFAYDADMEWDLGLPWYRPTRINHVTSGAEFGWRHGSGKWPDYFEDSLGSVVDIGPGSPVGVTFGTGAAFPTEYQEALYVLDWTYGIIYAIHLKPDGASYVGKLEPFVTGKPFPLTDVAIGEDGHMYVTTGGRRGESRLYRVSYYGVNDKTPPTVEPLTELAQLRKEIETLHKPGFGADKLDMFWDHLGHRDRAIRFAARVALEHMKPEVYIDKALSEKDALTRTSAGLALARHRHPKAMEVLVGVDPGTPSDETLNLAWLRSVGVAFARMGQPTDQQRDDILAKLNKLEVTSNDDVLTELVRLRVFLEDPTVIEFALNLMNRAGKPKPPSWLALIGQNDRYGSAIQGMVNNPPPTDQLGIAFMLRNIKDGWTLTQRQAYFSWLNTAMFGSGGNSYKGYFKKIRADAVASLSEAEKAQLGTLIDEPTVAPMFPVVQPMGPGREWTTEQATKLVEQRMQPGTRDFDRGVGLYISTTCAQCHKVGDFGGPIGPDLTSVPNKWTIEETLLHTIEPNHEISDQYAMSVITTKDGKEMVGMVLTSDDSGVTLKPNTLAEETIKISREQIASVEESPVSTMPAGLVNALSADELADLIAYVRSRGDRDDEMFKQPDN